jgi:lipopolysaccharide/colanic/teichoic acid biosynthesis glycosyltransferase
MAGRPVRRRGKEWRERLVALLLLVPTSPVFIFCAVLIKLETLIDADARGPVFFKETRISQGHPFGLLKFRTLRASALTTLDPTRPTHIAVLEQTGGLTRAGKLIRQWYLDELPQLLNIVRGDMFLIGTRPWPVELYEEEMARGITRKRDMPAGLIGPVQASKGHERDPLELDLAYWDTFRTASAWHMLKLDLGIVRESLRTVLEHRGL